MAIRILFFLKSESIIRFFRLLFASLVPLKRHYSTQYLCAHLNVLLTKDFILIKFQTLLAGVAELADAIRSGRSEHYAHVGSTPTFGISPAWQGF